METPICDFVSKYASQGKLRLHMPGHKGKKFLGPEALDITEVPGADVLYSSHGILECSQKNAAGLFGAGKTVYSAEGSSLAVRAMLYLAVLWGKSRGRRPVIAAGRNAHKTFMTAAALLDAEIVWLYSDREESLLSCSITERELESALSSMEEKPAAVYITSPDYLGNMADIGKLSAVCRRHEVLLLVDNAHGAYLHFLPQSMHPMSLGADMCCDSAHKTLPVLTGGAYLHVSHCAPELIALQTERAMALFASTSPSYLILQSLDAANRYLAEGYRERLAAFAAEVSDLKNRLKSADFSLVGQEPLKLTVAAKSVGYTGCELAELLSEQNIVCEFFDKDFLTMMLTPETGCQGIQRLEKALMSVKKRAAVTERPPNLPRPERVMTPRQAIFAPSRELDIRQCRGKVLASASVACPPAIPIAVCGERIDDAVIECFEYYGVTSCSVVDE